MAKEACAVCLRILFLMLGIASLILSIFVTAECNFFIYDPAPVPNGRDDKRPIELVEANITYATVGLYNYDPDDGYGCRNITEDFELGSWFVAARIGASLAIIISLVALLCLLIDFICCRFPCSRFIINVLYWCAFLSQALTFLVYGTDTCAPSYRDGPFSCQPSNTTWLSLVTCILFFICAILACCVPKPIPLQQQLRSCNGDEEETTDSCVLCCCCNKKEEENEEGEEEETVEEGGGSSHGGAKGKGTVVTKEDISEKEESNVAEEGQVETHSDQIAIIQCLTSARRGKQEEIERQLELLTEYKDSLDESEYNERVYQLLLQLPNPDNYDAYVAANVLSTFKEEEGNNNNNSISLYESEYRGVVGGSNERLLDVDDTDLIQQQGVLEGKGRGENNEDDDFDEVKKTSGRGGAVVGIVTSSIASVGSVAKKAGSSVVEGTKNVGSTVKRSVITSSKKDEGAGDGEGA